MTLATEDRVDLTEFCMPSLGADMQAGTVVEWRVKPGDRVKRGDVIGVIETDKGAVDLEIFANGLIDQVVVPVGTQVPVGTVLALLRDGSTPRPSSAVAAPAPAPPATSVAAATMPPPPPSIVAAPAPSPLVAPAARVVETHHRISPLARKVAAEMHVDLANVTGTGTGGAICREDVLRAAASALVATSAPEAPPKQPRAQPLAPPVAVVPAAPPVTVVSAAAPDRTKLAERHAAMRRAIAAAMSRSNREIPHYYLETAVDMQRALDWLHDANVQRSVTDRLLPAVLLLKAVALAVHEVPEVNGFWVDERFQASEAIHLGVAISLRTGGLVTPAIHDTDTLSLDELSAALKDLVQRARAGALRSSELADATLTVTNLGDQGVEKVFGVIYPPQVALVGFGAVNQRPWAIDGLLGVRPILIATLAGDHRATDGHRGGLFLAAIDRLLQKPDAL